MNFESIMESVQVWFTAYGPRVAGALVLLVVGWICAGWVGSIVRRALMRAKIDETLNKFLSNMSRWLVLLLVGLMCLSIFGIETTSFAAAIGAAGITIGLAFQGTLANVAAGMMLLIFRPFSVGDVVTVAGQTGKINEIGLFTTAMDTFDKRRFIIPNGSIFGSVIENISFHSERRADVDVGVSYAADIDQTREVLTNAASAVPGILESPEPAILLLGLGDSAVNWSVRVWAPASDFGAVKQATVRAVKVALDEAGIEIPYPTMDVNVNQAANA